MKILYFGDVVGKPGRRAVCSRARGAVAGGDVDFVVANGENASGGIGIDPAGARELWDAGIDVLTSGNHIWRHKKIIATLESSDRLLRPANFPPKAPGRGWSVYETRVGVPIAVVNLIGRVFMGPADCPFRAADAILESIGGRAPIVFVDMHGEATSEKVAMGRHLDGRASAVVGSHTHVQTADEGVLPRGTAYISDVGMCGPSDSVIGMDTDQVVRRFVDQMPVSFQIGGGDVIVGGVIVDVDESTGRARSIERIRDRTEAGGA